MSFNKLQVVDFGRSKSFATGSTGVGYTLFDTTGVTVAARSIAGVHEMVPGTGKYGAFVSWPDDFHGSIVWDTGTFFSSSYYAVEEFNVEANNPKVDANFSMLQSITGSVQLIRDMTEGRWKIVNDIMYFYAPDNTTLVASFSLYDDNGMPSSDSVFERVRNP